jgi:hypothetical protein
MNLSTSSRRATYGDIPRATFAMEKESLTVLPDDFDDDDNNDVDSDVG